ncbi:MAG TPA: amidohydrolase family protein [Jatrophihabitans sp.]|nr:amidohydrolase family protein [Jatrophihabitans sp.]
MQDADVPAWWGRLGLPGLFDVHVHFMPERVMRAVWRYFDNAARNYGREWPIQYRGSDAERLEILRALGVRHFPALLYPHKPDMAESLSAWAREFAAGTPDCLPTGTFFPESSAERYVREALDAGTRIFKAHVQVGGYDPRDPLLEPVWGMLAEAGVPVVVHCGSGPLPGPFTGPGPFGDVLRAHPRLAAIIAHCGAPDFAAHLDMVEQYPNVHVDTTMVGTPYMETFAPLGRDVIARLGALQDRVLLGADFPNIPYPYAQQLAALESWELGDDWLRAVCWHNAARLFGV